MKQKIYKIIAYIMGSLTALLVVLNLALVTARADDFDHDISDIPVPSSPYNDIILVVNRQNNSLTTFEYNVVGIDIPSTYDITKVIMVHKGTNYCFFEKNDDRLTLIRVDYQQYRKQFEQYHPDGLLQGPKTDSTSTLSYTWLDYTSYVDCTCPWYDYIGDLSVRDITNMDDLVLQSNPNAPHVPDVNVYGGSDGITGSIPWKYIYFQFQTNQTSTDSTQPFGAVAPDSPYFMVNAIGTNRFGIYNVEGQGIVSYGSQTLFATWHSHNAEKMYDQLLPLYDAHTLSLFSLVDGAYKPVEQFDLVFQGKTISGFPTYYQIRVYGNNITLADSFWGTTVLSSSFRFVESVDDYTSYGYFPKTSNPGLNPDPIPDVVVPGGSTDSNGNILTPGGGNVSIGDSDFNINEYLNNSSVQGFITILSGFMSFLPPWLWALLGFSMTAFTVIAVYKFIRG